MSKKFANGGNLKVPVLTYHSIDDSGSVISTTPGKFQSQMQYLAESSFKVISLKDVTICIRENRPFPSEAVAITFDDGFKNIYDIAYPVLKEFGFKATVFLVPGYCGKNNQFDGQLEGIPTMDLLGWDEIMEMAINGIDIGAHTMSHPNLSELSIDQACEEIVKSKSMIEKQLDMDVLFFAYPYGKLCKEVRRIVQVHFYGACSTELDFSTLSSDIYSLERIDMYYFSKNNFFGWIDRRLFHRYVKCRKVLRSFKNLVNNTGA